MSVLQAQLSPSALRSSMKPLKQVSHPVWWLEGEGHRGNSRPPGKADLGCVLQGFRAPEKKHLHKLGWIDSKDELHWRKSSQQWGVWKDLNKSQKKRESFYFLQLKTAENSAEVSRWQNSHDLLLFPRLHLFTILGINSPAGWADPYCSNPAD